MFRVNNFTNNDDIRIVESLGAFTVVEYLRDLSVLPASAVRTPLWSTGTTMPTSGDRKSVV